jgi:hypothetical protein
LRLLLLLLLLSVLAAIWFSGGGVSVLFRAVLHRLLQELR